MFLAALLPIANGEVSTDATLVQRLLLKDVRAVEQPAKVAMRRTVRREAPRRNGSRADGLPKPAAEEGKFELAYFVGPSHIEIAAALKEPLGTDSKRFAGLEARI